jgi:hypothetical protein
MPMTAALLHELATIFSRAQGSDTKTEESIDPK